MKRKVLTSIIFTIFIIINSSIGQSLKINTSAEAIPDSALYLGQTPPGNIPVIFAPGIISLSNRHENVITISPDQQQLFFSIGDWPNRRTLFMKYENGSWTNPDTVSFSKNRSVDEPSFSPDGNRVYYYTYAPGFSNNTDIHYSEKQDTLWSDPVNVGTPLNSSSGEYHPCVVNDSSIYFVNSSGKVCRSQYENGVYENRVILPAFINDGLPSSYLDAYVAPDESYLIFNSKRSGGYGSYDLYITFKNTDGSWIDPINLGNKINTSANEIDGDISPDGKYMTFNRNLADFYWVSASFIDSIKQTITDIEIYESGLSQDFNLLQNYPNPFNPETNISFSVQEKSFVALKVYDVLGREVAELVNDYKEKGNYQVKFDGSRLSSGVYFYKLTSGNNNSTKKMLLVK